MQKEGAQVFRRRSSFSKAGKVEQAQSTPPSGLPSLDQHIPEGTTAWLPPVSCSGNDLMRQSMALSKHRSLKVMPQSVFDIPAGSLVADAAQASDNRATSTTQHSLLSSITHPEVKKAKQLKQSNEVIMHDALCQSLAQVRACTNELQKQQSEQHRMHEVLQIMNAQIETLFHKPMFQFSEMRRGI